MSRFGYLLLFPWEGLNLIFGVLVKRGVAFPLYLWYNFKIKIKKYGRTEEKSQSASDDESTFVS